MAQLAEQPGRFITVEGSEGAGKSTNISVLCSALDADGIDYHCTREPGGTAFAEEIRALLLKPREERFDHLTELLLLFAARRQHVVNVIQPRITSGQWVVCDRFTDATYAYQGSGRGLPLEWIDSLRLWVQGSLEPDITLYLDLAPEVGAARIADRELDRLERERQAYFEAVRQGYLELASRHSRIRIIDASQNLADVGRQVRTTIEAYIRSLSSEGQ